MKANKFRGQFEAQLDAKSRLALPASIRTGLGKDLRLVLTQFIYKNQKCLDIYTWSAWLDLEKKIDSLPSLNGDVQAFKRFYISAGQILELDGQGRVLIPKGLKTFAGLEKDLQLVGMGTKMEVWDRSVWLKLQTEFTNSFETVQSAIDKLDKGED